MFIGYKYLFHNEISPILISYSPMKGSNFQNKILNGLMIDLFSLPTLIIFTMGMKNFEHNCIFVYKTFGGDVKPRS